MADYPIFHMTRFLVLAGLMALPAAALAVPTVQAPAASPNYVSVGQSSGLNVTAYVKGDAANPVIGTGVNLQRVDATGKVLATLGLMYDDGTNGDVVAGDGIFTRNISVNEAVAGDIRLQVSAAFYKRLSRVKSGVTPVPAVASINGFAVPPAPDPVANAVTLGGVDVDNNGIRDDIDRLIASEFGAKPDDYAKAVNFSRTEQAAIQAPSPETVSQHLDQFRCISDSQMLSQLSKITRATMDTPARRGAYGKTFAGALITSEGCAQ